jgi:hypothetical protein
MTENLTTKAKGLHCESFMMQGTQTKRTDRGRIKYCRPCPSSLSHFVLHLSSSFKCSQSVLASVPIPMLCVLEDILYVHERPFLKLLAEPGNSSPQSSKSGDLLPLAEPPYCRQAVDRLVLGGPVISSCGALARRHCSLLCDFLSWIASCIEDD